jgi:hypothetical protein
MLHLQPDTLLYARAPHPQRGARTRRWSGREVRVFVSLFSIGLSVAIAATQLFVRWKRLTAFLATAWGFQLPGQFYVVNQDRRCQPSAGHRESAP